MRLNYDGSITLSERNLRALLAKVGQPESLKTLMGGSEAEGVVVRSESDESHYALREPGPVHPDTISIMGKFSA